MAFDSQFNDLLNDCPIFAAMHVTLVMWVISQSHQSIRKPIEDVAFTNLVHDALKNQIPKASIPTSQNTRFEVDICDTMRVLDDLATNQDLEVVTVIKANKHEETRESRWGI